MRAKEGPDTCLSVTGESAVSRAIATSAERSGQPIFYPYQGTTFNSFEEAKEFYNLYSWEIGFGIRVSRARQNGNEYTTRRDLVCCCEGFCKNPLAASFRTGCKAMLRLHRTESHGWIVTKIIPDHNHPLSDSYGQKNQWGSHGAIDPLTKDFIKKLRENNVTLGRVCSIIGVMSASTIAPVRKQVVRNLCAKLAQEDIKDDIGKTMQVLESMKREDKDMQVRFQKDDEGRITTMLWCTGKNQVDYKHFGDVVTFDTTYRTNLYNLPFGIFVGVNNHYQPIVFGGVLLRHERTEDFEWAFSNFIEIMGGKQPQTILTDQCQAMAAAIKSTLKESRHRWCRWHVLRKAKQKIGTPYSKRSGFKREFNRLITEEISATAFERRWSELLKEFKLESNKFMARAYKFRGMWAKPYFMNIFCAGMTSTQRSESANHMLKRFIQRSAPMHVFVSKFRDFQFARNQEEEKENHVTKQVSRRRRIGVPIEQHAETIYTRAMHERFYNELYESGSFAIVEKGIQEERFTVVHTKEIGRDDARVHVVRLAGAEKVTCTCGLYEHVGLLCRHSWKVLVHLDRTEIPPGNIMYRWTKHAGPEYSPCTRELTMDQVSARVDGTKRHVLLKRALEFAHGDDPIDDEAFAEAMRAMDAIVPRKDHSVSSFREHGGEVKTSGPSLGNAESMPTACPPRPIRTGRPRNTSLKSWQKHEISVKKVSSTERPDNILDINDEEGNIAAKTRKVDELMRMN
ncbi:hypothetical protein BDA96_03G411500 [Sorghum bicolor]|uniref:Protein FAR1-RELATED SEQUENCE n=1 Tax=Sorghum bicolor TaxID=4558 RepID=A0A921RK23_SORBI|nr:hypothetical protein BDA96_03G411500 [Sorghum bicolor]